MGDNTEHRPKYDTARDLQMITVKGRQFLEAKSHSTDADAEPLTEQEMPVLMALRNEKRAQDKGHRRNK